MKGIPRRSLEEPNSNSSSNKRTSKSDLVTLNIYPFVLQQGVVQCAIPISSTHHQMKKSSHHWFGWTHRTPRTVFKTNSSVSCEFWTLALRLHAGTKTNTLNNRCVILFCTLRQESSLLSIRIWSVLNEGVLSEVSYSKGCRSVRDRNKHTRKFRFAQTTRPTFQHTWKHNNITKL